MSGLYEKYENLQENILVVSFVLCNLIFCFVILRRRIP